MGRLGDGGDIGRDRVPLAADRLADVDDHVELGRSVGHGLPGLEDLDRRGVPAVREADGRADGDARSLRGSAPPGRRRTA